MRDFLYKVWGRVRIPFLILALVYIAFVIAWMPRTINLQKTADTVEKIRNQRIELKDVLTADFLPPEPTAEVDATIEGIDLNKNGIRDDLDWKIFKAHPDSGRIRAAELQYAKALQLYLTDVFNEETWKAASIQEDRAYFCVGDLYALELKRPAGEASEEEWNKYLRHFSSNPYEKEVKEWVLNTNARQEAYDKAFENITSVGSGEEPYCDFELEKFSN